MIKHFVEKYRIFIGIFLLLILPVVFVFFFVREKSVSVSAESGFGEGEAETMTLFVDISGQVNSPGVYEIGEGKIVWDLVELAGGFSEKVDLEFVAKNINLSRKLVSEDKIYIPQKGEFVDGSIGPGSGQSERVNLNTASLEELDTLSGVGPSTAQKIIDSRPYKAIEDLKNVPGIGDARFEELKDKVTI